MAACGFRSKHESRTNKKGAGSNARPLFVPAGGNGQARRWLERLTRQVQAPPPGRHDLGASGAGFSRLVKAPVGGNPGDLGVPGGPVEGLARSGLGGLGHRGSLAVSELRLDDRLPPFIWRNEWRPGWVHESRAAACLRAQGACQRLQACLVWLPARLQL